LFEFRTNEKHKKMPRKADYLDVFREILSDPAIRSAISLESGEIKHPQSKSAKIVTEIVNLLADAGFLVNNNTIYSRIRQAKAIEELLGIKVNSNQDSEAEVILIQVPVLEDPVDEVHEIPVISAQLSEDQYIAIYPVSRKVEGRTRTYPKTGWTDVVQIIVSETLTTPCAFRFQFQSIKNVFCVASCNECKMTVHIYLAADKTLAMKVIQPPDESVLHQKSRQLRGNLRNIDTKDAALNHYNRKKLENASTKGIAFVLLQI
jgi:hypothetical protein